MGASVWGGSGIDGTVFSVTRNGAVSTVYSFNGSSGANPDGPLISGTDGNYYGTASGGGSSGLGTIYQVTSSGVTVLYVFSSADQYAGGSSPTGGLLQATNGNFYGTASGGGTQNLGTVYRLSMGLGPFVTPVPGFGRVGDTVQVLGTSLSGATSVTFNGVPATITAAGATEITVTVPSGATSGPLQVAKPAGTLTSNVSFSVRQ
jgi:uncharacterized repeat protein (TIGR03803 family)